MTISSINPETLKQCRKRGGLSQEGLAKVSKVSKKTIARIEAGRPSANSTSIKRLSDALRVTPEKLSGQSGPDERDKRNLGYCTLRTSIDGNAGLAFQMVEKCYGISQQNQIALAPLFTALLAEGSLAWRRQKLEEAEEAANTLMDADYGHRLFVVAGARAEEGAHAERESIERRDVFGEKVMEYAADSMGIDPESTDPFTEYLKRFAGQSGAELVRIPTETMSGSGDFYEWEASSQFGASSVSYSINPEELDRLTGGDRWARTALQRGHVKIADIPEDLLDDDVSDKRIEWLGNKISQDERDEFEAWVCEILASF